MESNLVNGTNTIEPWGLHQLVMSRCTGCQQRTQSTVGNDRMSYMWKQQGHEFKWRQNSSQNHPWINWRSQHDMNDSTYFSVRFNMIVLQQGDLKPEQTKQFQLKETLHTLPIAETYQGRPALFCTKNPLRSTNAPKWWYEKQDCVRLSCSSNLFIPSKDTINVKYNFAF